MIRTMAIVVLALSACSQPAHSGKPAEPPEAHASRRAREALAQHLGIASDDVAVSRIESRSWNDSSMGCGKPGTVALTVITEGYAVLATAQGREYRVHVSPANAIVCDTTGLVRRDPRTATRGLGLDVMMERARQDLARRLGVDPGTIRLAGMRPRQWPDSGLGCPLQDEKIVAGAIDGLQLSLKHAGRVFTYHTDRRTVRPCPAIEAQ